MHISVITGTALSRSESSRPLSWLLSWLFTFALDLLDADRADVISRFQPRHRRLARFLQIPGQRVTQLRRNTFSKRIFEQIERNSSDLLPFIVCNLKTPSRTLASCARYHSRCRKRRTFQELNNLRKCQDVRLVNKISGDKKG